MISSSLEWYEYIKSKGGYEYLWSNDYISCVHDSSWGCSCYKKQNSERKKFKNIERLLKWKIDLSNEPTSGIVLVDVNDEEKVYVALPSMKTRYKGYKQWCKLPLRSLKKILTGEYNQAINAYYKLTKKV